MFYCRFCGRPVTVSIMMDLMSDEEEEGGSAGPGPGAGMDAATGGGIKAAPQAAAGPDVAAKEGCSVDMDADAGGEGGAAVAAPTLKHVCLGGPPPPSSLTLAHPREHNGACPPPPSLGPSLLHTALPHTPSHADLPLCYGNSPPNKVFHFCP